MDRGLIVDLVVVGIFAFAIVRGWRHGSAREAFGFVGLLVGVLVAPFFAGFLGGAIASLTGMSENLARLIALVVLIAAAEIPFALWGKRATEGIQISGPRALDRAGGVVLAMFRAITVTTLFLFAVLAISASYPELPGYAQGVQESAMGSVFADPASPVTSFYDSMLTRTDSMRSLTLWVRQQTRFRVRVPSDRLEFAGTKEISELPKAGRELMKLINDERAEEGLEPLEWCEVCAQVGLAHSEDMYVNGYFSHVDGRDRDPFDRMKAAGIEYLAAGENLAIAPTVADAHNGLMISPDHRANILRSVFDEVGIGVYQGPYGVMVTQIFRQTP